MNEQECAILRDGIENIKNDIAEMKGNIERIIKFLDIPTERPREYTIKVDRDGVMELLKVSSNDTIGELKDILLRNQSKYVMYDSYFMGYGDDDATLEDEGFHTGYKVLIRSVR